MTSGGAMGGQADVLYIDVKARLEDFEQKLSQMEREAEQSGERTGSKLGAAMSTGLKVATGAAVGLGLAVAGAVPAMQELAKEAAQADATNQMFAKTLERFKVPAKDAEAAVSDLSTKLGVAPEVIREGMTTILRAGGTLEDATRTITAAGASAAAAGGDIANAVGNSTQAIAMGRSELLESAGIMTNASDAYKDYAKSIGVSADELTEAQKIQAFSNAVYKESRFEIADLSTIMGGYAGQQARAAQVNRELRQVIGQLVLPIVTALGEVLGNVAQATLKWLQGLDKEKIAQFGGVIKSVAGTIQTGLVTAFNVAKVVVGEVSAGFQKLSVFAERNKEILIPLGVAIGTVAGALAIHKAATIAATAVTSAWTVATTAATTASVALRAAIAFITGPVGLAIAAITALIAAGVYLYRNWDEVKAKAQAIWGSLREIVTNAINSVTSFLRGIDLKEVGLDIVRGLANGILAGPKLVLEAAKGLGTAVMNGVKSVLKIKSPSQVMIEAGEDTGRGLVIGLEKTTPAVQRAAALMGTAVYQGVVDTLAGAFTDMQNAARQLDVVRSLFGEGEVGLKTAFDYYGVSGLEQLKRQAPTAARLIEAAYADVLTAQQEAVAETERLNAAILASDEETSRDRTQAIAQVWQADQEAADDAAITVDFLRSQIAELIAQGRDPSKSGFTDWLDELVQKGGRAGAAAAAVKADLENLIRVAQFAAQEGPVAPRGTRAPAEVITPSPARGTREAPMTSTAGRGELNAAAAAWKQATLEAAGLKANVDAYRDSLKGLTLAQLEAAKAQALATGAEARYNVIVEEITRVTKEQADTQTEATKNTQTLADARQKLTDTLKGGAAPYAAEIASLEALRGKPGVVAEELDKLIASYQDLQTKALKQKALEDRINTWANYAQRLIPVVSDAMYALGGATSEVAGQWAKDLGSMVSDITAFATAIAKGDYVGAAIQALSTIFGWFSRNKKAAEEAAKATAEYNKAFQFSQNGYGTRQVSSYTTGFLFWSTTHYKEQVDELKRDVALALEGGFANGIKDGFTQAVAQNDFSLFEKSLRTSVGKSVLDGLMDTFVNQKILAKIIGPAIDGYLKTGDAAALQAAIQGASGEAQKFYDTILAPIAKEFGLLGSAVKPTAELPSGDVPSPDSAISKVQVSVSSPIVGTLNLDLLATLSSVLDRFAPRVEQSGQNFVQSAGEFGAHIARLDRILTRAETDWGGLRGGGTG